MMSTFSGLLVGMLIAALVTVLYGQQLSHSLRDAINKHPSVKALLEQTPAMDAEIRAGHLPDTAVSYPPESTGVDTVDPAVSEKSEVESEVELTAAVDADMELQDVSAAAPQQRLDPEPVREPTLEQRWLDYAASADKLLPVGSFPWQRCFQRSAASYDLPVALLLAIASGESNFDPAARSDKDAIGLMQIRWPTTSRHLGVRRQADLYDPCTNVDAGARYLRELAQHYADNLHLAVAAYNYGPSRVLPTQVPEGALWYSHYIFQHLQQVLGLEPTATSQLVAAPPRPGGGREVLMTFNSAHRARDFIAFLTSQVPGLNLQQQSEVLGRHEVVLLYGDQAGKGRAMQALAAAGLEYLGPPSNPRFQL
jgi:hypothetical protein